LVADLWRESAGLLRGEAALAKAELSEKVSQVGSGIAALAAAGAVLFAGFLLVLFAVVGLVALALPEDYAPWLAPLIVGLVVLAVGWFLLSAGRNKLQAEKLKSSHSIRAVRHDAEVIKEHI
jgi:xanthine/uracil permease